MVKFCKCCKTNIIIHNLQYNNNLQYCKNCSKYLGFYYRKIYLKFYRVFVLKVIKYNVRKKRKNGKNAEYIRKYKKRQR